MACWVALEVRGHMRTAVSVARFATGSCGATHGHTQTLAGHSHSARRGGRPAARDAARRWQMSDACDRAISGRYHSAQRLPGTHTRSARTCPAGAQQGIAQQGICCSGVGLRGRSIRIDFARAAPMRCPVSGDHRRSAGVFWGPPPRTYLRESLCTPRPRTFTSRPRPIVQSDQCGCSWFF